MIIGLGIDIIEVSRISGLLSMGGDAFLNTVYTAFESDFALLMANPAPVLAAMFAAKEAFVKALGTGFIGALDFRQIEVQFSKNQIPFLILSGEACNLIKKNMVVSTLLSVSFTINIAIAVVILEK